MTGPANHISTFLHLAEAEQLIEELRFDKAASLIIAHLRQHPEDARGLSLLGSVAMRTGALYQAEQFLRKAIRLGADTIENQRCLASILNQQDRLTDALAQFELLEARLADPDIAQIRALILDKLGRHSAALALLEGLVAREKPKPSYWISYGHSLRFAGRTEDAIAAYRRAIDLDLELGEAWWALANIKSKVISDDDMANMESALTVAIDDLNIAPLHFALGRGFHDREQFDQAFHHYSEANRIRADAIGYQSTELTREVDEYARSFNAAPCPPKSLTSDDVPVFIVSLPRSGSTLLEQMLGSHPAIEPAGELPHVQALIRKALEIHTRRGPVTVPEMIQRLTDDEAKALGDEYLSRARPHRPQGLAMFIDKLPHNWTNILFIRRILPHARIIDIRRSAMDCCFSNFTQSFSRAHSSSFSLEHIGQAYVDYVRFMEHLDRVAPGLVHHVRYEQLIEEPEPELRSIFEYLGIEWNDAPLNFHQLDRVVRTPSAEQVRRPLNRSGVDVWKPYDQWLGPLRQVLGPLANI